MGASGKGPRGLLGALGAVKEVPGGLGRFGGPLGDLLRAPGVSWKLREGSWRAPGDPRELSEGSREGGGGVLGAQEAAEKMADH